MNYFLTIFPLKVFYSYSSISLRNYAIFFIFYSLEYIEIPNYIYIDLNYKYSKI